MKKICRNCYYENPETATYCCSCGSRLESPKNINVYVKAASKCETDDSKPRTIGKNCHEIEAIVKAIIVDKLCVEESEVVDCASFVDDLGADSLDMVELVMEFEKKFSIFIPDDQAERIDTVGDAVSYIVNNIK